MGRKGKSFKKDAVSSLDAKSILSTLEAGTVLPSKEEYMLALEKLRTEYKKIAVKNLIEKKKLDHVKGEAVTVQNKNVEIKTELDRVRADHRTADAKSLKLQQLSQQLSARIKAMDVKSTEEIKAEKEDRLRMSNEFSNSIKDISAQLEALARRRESIGAENSRLKTILKAYLEEFDKFKEQDSAAEAEKADGRVEELAEGDEPQATETDAVDKDVAAEPMDLVALVTEDSSEGVAAESVSHVAPVEGAVTEASDESAQTPIEAAAPVAVVDVDEARIALLKQQENELREQSRHYMGVFDEFQARLSKSNKVFAEKQAAIESLTKEIRALDKESKAFTAKIGELSASNRAFFAGNERMQKEREKITRASEKYQDLIDTFQSEISAMEARL